MSDHTSRAALQRARQRLDEAGITDPQYEARLLLAKAMGKPPASLIAAQDEPLSGAQIDTLDRLTTRRAAREPLQHILGDVGFMALELKTDHRALIPRWDSETVVLLALEVLREAQIDAPVIADLGTGSGALLAALLDERQDARGIAVEQSGEALSLAEENFTALGLSSRVECFHGSWADWTDWGRCDLIISNPPYIKSAVIDTLEPEVRAHEPLAALDGGKDGLNAYREIISLAQRHMKAGAHFVLEIGFDQKAEVSALLTACGFERLLDRQDLGGQDRGLAARKG